MWSRGSRSPRRICKCRRSVIAAGRRGIPFHGGNSPHRTCRSCLKASDCPRREQVGVRKNGRRDADPPHSAENDRAEPLRRAPASPISLQIAHRRWCGRDPARARVGGRGGAHVDFSAGPSLQRQPLSVHFGCSSSHAVATNSPSSMQDRPLCASVEGRSSRQVSGDAARQTRRIKVTIGFPLEATSEKAIRDVNPAVQNAPLDACIAKTSERIARRHFGLDSPAAARCAPTPRPTSQAIQV